jgi:hypothetical protein
MDPDGIAIGIDGSGQSTMDTRAGYRGIHGGVP